MNSTIFSRSASRYERAVMTIADACAHRDEGKMAAALREYLGQDLTIVSDLKKVTDCDHLDWSFTLTEIGVCVVLCRKCGEKV